MKAFFKANLGVALAATAFVACSSEPKSVEYYKNDSKARQAKIQECGEKEKKFLSDEKNWKLKNPNEALEKYLGKTLAQECKNARVARDSTGFDTAKYFKEAMEKDKQK